MTHPMRFAVVGTGWRSDFHLRMAREAPDRLEAVAVVAHSDAGAERSRSWGIPVVRTIGEALACSPDFVIASVTWDAMPQVVTELVDAGAHVLAETPPAPTVDGLRALWAKVGGSGRVQVAEQYMRMPGHAARLAVVRSGVIGAPTAVQISSTHLYHATSMMRTFLDVGPGEVRVNARSFVASQMDPLTPDGWVENPAPRPLTTTIATLDFGGGRMGLYDFTDNQWWNPLLARRLVVRGERGEIVDDTVTHLTTEGVIVSPISYRRTGIDMNLEGNDLVSASFEGRMVYRNPWVGTRLSEDDIAVASLLEEVGLWTRSEGPAPYPLADACQDHLLGLAIEESARSGADVRVAREPWAS
ncbi:Gfo/Idh/MocA family protein [Tessaracoccus antarcticus]|uniref:Gfo/Idh/MocA family oxidoreductase n=1 Tax=Tessaracoccus antarcticus TaxID=2479848 RepID=A0A3M0GCB2_9ACTN|nr:Gfo/Idh/MocA family oxidoreductase [Tessaracoccus antarcticus]RMB62474.1 gfo/Idh/MocA family oxidoreductase [Tessaracoccus antarcticus]